MYTHTYAYIPTPALSTSRLHRTSHNPDPYYTHPASSLTTKPTSKPEPQPHLNLTKSFQTYPIHVHPTRTTRNIKSTMIYETITRCVKLNQLAMFVEMGCGIIFWQASLLFLVGVVVAALDGNGREWIG